MSTGSWTGIVTAFRSADSLSSSPSGYYCMTDFQVRHTEVKTSISSTRLPTRHPLNFGIQTAGRATRPDTYV